MRLTSRAPILFRGQSGQEQRRLLRTVLKTASWQTGELRLEFEEPFETLRRSNRASARKEMEKIGSGRDSGIWLPGIGSNHELDRFLDSSNFLISQSY